MKHIGTILKALREEKNMTQQQVADILNMHRSNYSKVESGERDLSLDAVSKISDFFGMTIDQLINYDKNNKPKEVIIEDKSLIEQVKLINELEPEEKNMIFKMVNTFLTQKKFKDFFNKNVASL